MAPNDVLAYVDLGVFLKGVKKPDEAAAEFAAAASAFRRVDADRIASTAYYMIDHDVMVQESVDVLLKALKDNPEANLGDWIGWGYFKLGQLDQAKHYLAEAERGQVRVSLDTEEHLAAVYERQGRTELARGALQKALQALPPLTSDAARIKAKLAALPAK